MQRFSTFLLIFSLALLVDGCATQAPAGQPRITTSAPQGQAIVQEAPTSAPSTPTETPLGPTKTAPSAPTLAENTAPGKPNAANAHIALILPLNVPAFRQPAEAVKQGVLAAAKTQPGSPSVQIYPTSEEANDVLAVYQQALNNGARVIVGPLTKSAVVVLAESNLVSVPTLALSVPDVEITNRNLYLFGLSLDVEARQVAQYMRQEGRQSVLIISSPTTLGKRLKAAFSETWQRQGGNIVGRFVYTAGTDLGTLQDNASKVAADAIFLALGAQEASLVRPYLPSNVASYATSQVFSGQSGTNILDLGGVRFLDMPWMLQADHPAVMIFARPDKALNSDSERLYAMGIDAYRLAQLFYLNTMPTSGPILDGVTGQIGLSRQQFTRELTAAEFQANTVVVLDNAQP